MCVKKQTNYESDEISYRKILLFFWLKKCKLTAFMSVWIWAYEKQQQQQQTNIYDFLLLEKFAFSLLTFIIYLDIENVNQITFFLPAFVEIISQLICWWSIITSTTSILIIEYFSPEYQKQAAATALSIYWIHFN